MVVIEMVVDKQDERKVHKVGEVVFDLAAEMIQVKHFNSIGPVVPLEMFLKST